MSRMCGTTGIVPTKIDEKEPMREHWLLFCFLLLTNYDNCIIVLVN